MTAKTLCSHFFNSQKGGWKDVGYQMKIAKDLVERYTDEQLLFALELFKGKMYSLGFLNEKNMGYAINKMHDTIQINYEVGGNIAERNRAKLQRFTYESRFGEGHYFDLLKE